MIPKFFNSLWLLLITLPFSVFAQDYPAYQSLYVNDFAGIIDADTEMQITQTLTALRRDKGIEMTVVTVQTLADYNSTQSVPAFATGLFNHWGVGDATRNDGVLFLVALNEREVFIALGAGYPESYSARMDEVFARHVKPHFLDENYARGIQMGVNETIKRTAPVYVDLSETRDTNDGTPSFTRLLIALGIAAVICWGAIRWSRNPGMRRCPQCRRRKLNAEQVVVRKPTRDIPGEADETVTCNHCGYTQGPTRIKIPWGHIANNYPINIGGGFGGGHSSGSGGGGRW